MIANGSEWVKRLVRCGFSAADAADICWAFVCDGKFSELEAFVKESEAYDADRRQYV